MVIDASAIIAILKEEPGYEVLRDAIIADPDPKMSAVTAVELHIVMTTGLEFAPDAVRGVLRTLGIRLIPFDEPQSRIASRAHDTYGRRAISPAKLNFGDCLTYALAAHLGEPLLFVGNDFTHTDIVATVGA